MANVGKLAGTDKSLDDARHVDVEAMCRDRMLERLDCVGHVLANCRDELLPGLAFDDGGNGYCGGDFGKPVERTD